MKTPIKNFLNVLSLLMFVKPGISKINKAVEIVKLNPQRWSYLKEWKKWRHKKELNAGSITGRIERDKKRDRPQVKRIRENKGEFYIINHW